MTDDLEDILAEIVGAKNVLGREALAGLDPGFHPDNLAGDLAVFPGSVEEVSAVAAACAARRIPLVPQGGRTGLSGGATSEGAVVLGLRRMNAIERLDPLAATAVVQAGVTLQAVEEAANAHGLSVGIDLGARGSATIGGMIATNAGGMEAFRNGSMRARVLGLEAVLASGAVMGSLSEVPKCNEGYDLTQLFCGSEGTLGVVTRAALRLVPQVESEATLLIGVSDAASALEIMRAFQQAEDVALTHAEIMWRRYAEFVAAEIGLASVLKFTDAPAYLLLDCIPRGEDALLDLLSELAVEDAILAKNERERRDIWRIREESFIVDNVVPHCSWFDISVPLGRIDETVAGIEARLSALDPQIGVWVMGHLGDGNLHYTIGTGHPMDETRKAEVATAVYAGLKEIGGSFSAEHGIGTEKRAGLAKYTDPERLRLMRAIKAAFDPDGIMNPGKVL